MLFEIYEPTSSCNSYCLQRTICISFLRYARPLDRASPRGKERSEIAQFNSVKDDLVTSGIRCRVSQSVQRGERELYVLFGVHIIKSKNAIHIEIVVAFYGIEYYYYDTQIQNVEESLLDL
jgi:hypothetical protein